MVPGLKPLLCSSPCPNRPHWDGGVRLLVSLEHGTAAPYIGWGPGAFILTSSVISGQKLYIIFLTKPGFLKLSFLDALRNWTFV